MKERQGKRQEATTTYWWAQDAAKQKLAMLIVAHGAPQRSVSALRLVADLVGGRTERGADQRVPSSVYHTVFRPEHLTMKGVLLSPCGWSLQSKDRVTDWVSAEAPPR